MQLKTREKTWRLIVVLLFILIVVMFFFIGDKYTPATTGQDIVAEILDFR